MLGVFFEDFFVFLMEEFPFVEGEHEEGEEHAEDAGEEGEGFCADKRHHDECRRECVAEHVHITGEEAFFLVVDDEGEEHEEGADARHEIVFAEDEEDEKKKSN